MRKITSTAKSFGIPLICGLLIFVLFQFVFLIGYVPSTSMEPTIPEKSLIIGYRIYNDLQRGDIVIFRKDNQVLVKRIAAVPGDVVFISGSVVQVNVTMEYPEKIIEVPGEHFYLLGDNSAESFDSRYWDEPFLHKNYVIAKLLAPHI